MNIFTRISAAIKAFIKENEFHKMAIHWANQGAVNPYGAAIEEQYLRMKVEQFRTWASATYIENPNLTRDDLKQEWLKDVVGVMARSPLMREHAKPLKAAIVAIGEDMFVGQARILREAQAKQIVAEFRAKRA